MEGTGNTMSTLKLKLATLLLLVMAGIAGAADKPTTAEGWYKSAYDKRHEGDFDGGIADASEAIKLDAKNGKYWLERGISRLNKRDFDGALDDYNQAVELDPKNPE